MPYGYRPQRPGIVDPNDPRKKRLPLTPEEDPYGGIVPDFEVDLPEPVSPLPQVPLTQPSTIGMQTGAKLPMEQWQTPPRDLTSLRAWYSGAAEVPGAPPAPEWGKRTPTYSRLNPPPPRRMQAPTPAPSPTAPVGFMAPRVGSVNDALQAQMQAPLQQAAIQARQPVTTRPTLGTPSQPTVSPADRQRFTLAEAERRALRNRSAVQGAGQYLQEAGMGDLSPERFAPMPQPPSATPPQPASWRERAAMQSVSEGAGAPITQGGLNAVSRRAQEALLMGSAGAAAGSLALGGGKPGYRTVPQIARDVSLEFGAGTLNLGGMAADAADIATRSMGMMNPGYDPKAPGGFQALRDASANINKASETLLAQRTPEYLQRRAAMERQLAVAPQDVMSQIAAYAAAIYEDPSMAEQAIVTNLPQMFPSLAAGKIASLGKAAQALKATRALSATAGVGLVQTAVDSAKSSYDTLKQQYMQQGMSSQQADQLAFQNSLPSFIVGGGIGAFTGGTGAEAALFKGGAAGLGQRAARIASELGGEVLEETAPQAITNVQLGRPVTQGLGRTIAETMVATAPFAGMAGMGRTDGGANKVPDALQTETGPAVQPPTGQFGGVIPPSAERQAYETWTQAGGPRAPEAYQVLRKSRSLPGRLGLPPVGLPPVGMPEGQAPQRPTAPLGLAPSPTVTPRTQVPTQPAPDVAPTEQPEEAGYELKGEWPVPLTFRTPVQLQMRRQQGPDTATTVGMGLEDLRNEYEMTGEGGQEPYFTKMEGTRARRVKRPPTARDVQGEHGYIAERMYHAPSLREFIDKGGAAAYGVKPEDNAIDAYERIVGGIAAEMTELTGVPYSISDVQNMRRTAGIGKPAGWQQWFEAYGKARGLDTERDMDSILAPTTGKQMGAMMPSSELENIFGVGGKKAGQADRGAVQEALQEDIAKLFNIPFDRVSLTQVTPVMWKQWAAVRNISPEGVKQLQQVIRAAEEFKGRTRVTPKEAEARKERAKQPVSEWYEQTYGRPTSLKGKPSPPSPPAGAAPAAPTRPTPPSPAAPAAPTAPTAPSPLVTRYQSQVGRGVSRAPLAFQPRSYTEGVASIERARAEREEARQARERLKKGSPFAKARQAEEARIGEVIEGRRPEPPAATEPVTPKPTPPAPPAPAGEAVTPDAMKKAGIDVPFMESLAKKYGLPPIPVREAAGINEPLGRAANMLERAAGKSKSSEELAEILKRAQRMKAHRAVIAVAKNPSTDEQTFEKAVKDKEANKYVLPSYWEGIRAERAERAGAGRPSTPAPAGEAVTPPTPRKATPVKKESAPKPAAPTGQPITEKSLTEQGWTKNSSIDFSGPNGERLEYDSNRRGGPWVYTDRSGNTESFASAREAIQGILSRPAATPAPEAPVTPKTTKPRKEKAEAAPVPQTTQEEEGELPVAEFARQQEQVAARREAFLKDNPDLILTAEDYVKTLAPDVQQRYAKYKALQAKFEAAKQAGSQVRFGATSGKQLKELTRELEFISKEVGRAKGVLSAVIDREPVNASTVDALGIKLPKGYQRQGNQFVFEGEAATATTAPEVPTEVRQIFDTLDLPQGKKSKTRKIVEAMHPDLGKKAIFVNDNIEQIIAEAEANGKVTKECP